MWTLRPMWVCLAMVLAPAPAWPAEGAADPALRYRVVAVAAGDRLNVRDQPGIEANVLGALVPDAENVVITGSVMNVAGSDWWEIVFVEGYLSRGWVNSGFLEPMDQRAPESDYPLLCGGTEPFWSFELGDGQAYYSGMDEKTKLMSASSWMMASGQAGRFAVGLEGDGKLGFAGIWRENDFCSDGMSDVRYPFGTILMRPGGEVLAGCCRRLH